MNYYKEPVNISNTLKRDLTSCNKDTYLLGRLAEGRLFYPGSETNEPISVIKGGYSTIFYLESLSDIPKPIQTYFSNLTDEL